MLWGECTSDEHTGDGRYVCAGRDHDSRFLRGCEICFASAARARNFFSRRVPTESLSSLVG